MSIEIQETRSEGRNRCKQARGAKVLTWRLSHNETSSREKAEDEGQKRTRRREELEKGEGSEKKCWHEWRNGIRREQKDQTRPVKKTGNERRGRTGDKTEKDKGHISITLITTLTHWWEWFACPKFVVHIALNCLSTKLKRLLLKAA